MAEHGLRDQASHLGERQVDGNAKLRELQVLPQVDGKEARHGRVARAPDGRYDHDEDHHGVLEDLAMVEK